MSQRVVVTAVAKDKPGIVAALTRAVFEMGGNLDDATMTRLHNTFTTMISAQLPEGRTPGDLRAVLAPVAERLELALTVQSVEQDETQPPAPDHLLTVYGADQPGIVYHIAQRLAEQGVNITDMDTRLAGSPESPVYVMLLEVVAGDRDLNADLAPLAAEMGVNVTVQDLTSEAL